MSRGGKRDEAGLGHYSPGCVFLSPLFPLATMFLPAHKLAGRDKGSMWDQLEDAAMETFSISNCLSLCDVFIPPAWEGQGLTWGPLGLEAKYIGSGRKAQFNLERPFFLSGAYYLFI